jgi:hypothetical protein
MTDLLHDPQSSHFQACKALRLLAEARGIDIDSDAIGHMAHSLVVHIRMMQTIESGRMAQVASHLKGAEEVDIFALLKDTIKQLDNDLQGGE